MCEKVLSEVIGSRQKREINAQLIMKTVADYYDISVEDLTRQTRRREYAVPRQYAMYLTRELTDMSLPQIGQAFGGRDHSTVLHACNTVDKNAKTNQSIASVVEDIKNLVTEGK